jgi:hypothetical protein
MALKEYQSVVMLGRLYEANLRGGVSGSEQITPSLWINSGSIDVYSSNSAAQPTLLSQMTLNTDDTGVQGISSFFVIPRWLAVVQNAGTSTEIVAAGLEIKNLAAIS